MTYLRSIGTPCLGLLSAALIIACERDDTQTPQQANKALVGKNSLIGRIGLRNEEDGNLLVLKLINNQMQDVELLRSRELRLVEMVVMDLATNLEVHEAPGQPTPPRELDSVEIIPADSEKEFSYKIGGRGREFVLGRSYSIRLPSFDTNSLIFSWTRDGAVEQADDGVFGR